MAEQILSIFEAHAGGPQATTERVLQVMDADLRHAGPYSRSPERRVQHPLDRLAPKGKDDLGMLAALGVAGSDSSNLFSLQLDSHVVGFGIALTLAAALLFGTSPAFRAARAYLAGGFGTHSQSISAATLRGPKVLVSAQLALCLTALVAAGLLGRSLQGLTDIDLGFNPDNLVYATVNRALTDFPASRVEGYLNDVERELEALPGVVSVSRLGSRPLEGRGTTGPVNIPGTTQEPGFDPRFVISINGVAPDAFETLGVSLLAGRTVDAAGSGVVVDQRFAEQFFPGQDVLGRRIGVGAADADAQYEIVGIARNAISLQLRDEPPPMLYVPLRGTGGALGESNFAIRTARDPGPLLQTIRTTVSSVSASVPLTAVRTQQELLDRMLCSERLLALLSAGFGLVATGLAAIGLSGLLGYAVARRTSEIGLRMALGAASDRIVLMVMKDSLKLIAAGLVVGIPCAFGVATLLESSLYELTPTDPTTLAASILVIVAVSLLAAFLPARRAARTSPSAALRAD